MEIESFDEFYVGTRATLLGQLTAMTADPELAKEVLQDAYAQAWQRWSRVSRLDDPAGWVRAVAWRRAVSAFRRRMVADRFMRTVGRTQAEGSVRYPVERCSTSRTLCGSFRTRIVGRSCCTICAT